MLLILLIIDRFLFLMNKNEVDEVFYYKLVQLVRGGDDLMKEVMQSWHK